MKKTLLLIAVLVIVFAGCDPNEPAIPDSKDFEMGLVTVSNNIVSVNVNFFANVGIGDFFLYIDSENDGLAGSADFNIKCNMTQVRIYRESPWGGSSGWYPTLMYSTTPTISGDSYTFTFPLNYIHPVFNPKFDFHYWFYSMDSLDRLPDITASPNYIAVSYP